MLRSRGEQMEKQRYRFLPWQKDLRMLSVKLWVCIYSLSSFCLRQTIKCFSRSSSRVGMYLKAVVMVVVRLGWKAEVEKDEVARVDVHFLFLVEEGQEEGCVKNSSLKPPWRNTQSFKFHFFSVSCLQIKLLTTAWQIVD